jgi:hypothetical protein
LATNVSGTVHFLRNIAPSTALLCRIKDGNHEINDEAIEKSLSSFLS